MNRNNFETQDYNVHIGFWVNDALGRFKGGTLTLDRQRGTILIAFIALYVGLAGSGVWNIVRFLLHRTFSSSHNTDGIYHQRQVILRNAGTAHSAAWELLQVSLAWRGSRVKHNTIRLLPIIGLSAVLSALFAAGGILSSHATSASQNTVLIADPKCGNLVLQYNDSAAVATDTANRSKKSSEYLAYALQCYQSNSTVGKCQTYVAPTLPYTLDRNATCPFDQALCRTKSNNLIMDTGFLESEKHLGVNGGPKFTVRQTRQCAPLVSKGYTRNETDTTTGREYVRYYYRSILNSTDLQPSFALEDLTWEAFRNNISSDGTLGRAGSRSPATYRYGVYFDYVTNDLGFSPLLLPALKHPYAQVSLIFLEGSSILYNAPVTDPWFSASTPLSIWSGSTTPSEWGSDTYLADEPASAVACATTTYVCNPRLPTESRCVATYKYPIFQEALASLWSNDDDRAGVQGALRLLTLNEVLNPDIFYSTPNLPTLMTQYSLSNNVQSDPIPSDRWQDEMIFSFQAGLVSLQAAMVETATGVSPWYDSEEISSLAHCSPRTACRAICGRQMIRSSAHLSFQVMSLKIILILGAALIIIGFGIEFIGLTFDRIIHRRHKGPSPNAYAQAEWQTGSPLQLQRLAHEALGLGAWSGSGDVIPVTQRGDVLGKLDVQDPNHPRLVHPSVFSSAAPPGNMHGEEKQPVTTIRPLLKHADT